jgi:hypothetical protein
LVGNHSPILPVKTNCKQVRPARPQRLFAGESEGTHTAKQNVLSSKLKNLCACTIFGMSPMETKTQRIRNLKTQNKNLEKKGLDL